MPYKRPIPADIIGGSSTEPAYYPFDHRTRVAVRSRIRAGSRPGDVQYGNASIQDEGGKQVDCPFRFDPIAIDQQTGPHRLDTKPPGRSGTALHLAEMDDHRGVGFDDVLQRTSPIAPLRQFHQRVTGRNFAVFGPSTRRTPAAGGKLQLQCRIECGAIDSGLSAGDDPSQHDSIGGDFARESDQIRARPFR